MTAPHSPPAASSTSPDPDKAPALALWAQLATRLTTLPLHYRSGHEESAAVSVFDLFRTTRELLTEHPDAKAFRNIAIKLLNDDVRPYSDRWHGWMMEVEDATESDGRQTLRFRDSQVRHAFRQELGELRVKLTDAKKELADLAKIEDSPNKKRGPIANLGAPLQAGIRSQVGFRLQAQNGDALVSPDEINAEEQRSVIARRLALGSKNDDDSPPDALKPVLNNAIGLALSGGGIRSATFCLGIVQVLAQHRLLRQFDYLSTVSGGGYLGAFLSCALGTRAEGAAQTATRESADARIKDVFQSQTTTADPETGKAEKTGVESGLLRHLRNSSKYLLGGGFLGKAMIAGLLTSGVLWNLMIVLPIPLGCALLAFKAGPALWGSTPAELEWFPDLFGSPIGWIFALLALMLAIGWLALPGIQMATHGKPPNSKRSLFRTSWETGTLVLGLFALAAGAIYAMPALFNGYEWLRDFINHLSIGQFSIAKLEQQLPAQLTSEADLPGVLPAPLVAAAGAVFAALAKFLGPQWPRLRSLSIKLFILSGPLLFLVIFLSVGNSLGLSRPASDPAPWNWIAVLAVTALLALWDWLFVNINTLSPHRYYRNRTCECYLARRIDERAKPSNWLAKTFSRKSAQGSVETLKQVSLSALGADATAPYHLINMAVNVPGSGNKNLRGRGSDFFHASRHFYGSPLTGYARSAGLAKVDPHFDLGTAMAVSAAAASSSMGFKSLPHFRFLMTLFNVRLGYWLSNPARPARNWWLKGAGPLYLYREMFATMDEDCRYLNLSDGGHIENLGAYELLRRRCKFIVCVDGGQEAGMECADLVRLQRYAEIDLGIRMRFDLSDLQIADNRLSRAHAILVKIDYHPDRDTHPDEKESSDQIGWMLYLKLAMTGVESSYVKDYKREHPDFPHQSTGDQIFEEDQFEAYRDLGETAMEGLLRKEIVGAASPDTIEAWFQTLADNLLPDNDEAFPKKP